MNLLDFVAISSLESEEHATRKDPKIISIDWILGLRCNFSCSYCSPYLHNTFSPHAKLEDIQNNLLKTLNNIALESKKELKFNITGGEPFVHPDIIEIFRSIYNLETTKYIGVVSNGSVPLEKYIEASKYLDQLVFSLHFERGWAEISNTIEKLIKLNSIQDLYLTTHVMAEHGYFEDVKKAIEILDRHNIKYIIRKIHPHYIDQEAVNRETVKDNNFLDNKKDLTYNASNDIIEPKPYYTKEELEFLEKDYKVGWNTMRIYDTHGEYQEINPDQLKTPGLNTFKNWTCFAGIDTLQIEADGTVYRAVCMEGGSIGSISEGITIPAGPIICGSKTCFCTDDIVIRKYKEERYSRFVRE